MSQDTTYLILNISVGNFLLPYLIEIALFRASLKEFENYESSCEE